MVDIFTSNASSLKHFGRRIARTKNGVVWTVRWDGNNALTFYYSTDNGATWNLSAATHIGVVPSTTHGAPAIFIDTNDRLHVAYIENGAQRVFYYWGAKNGETNWNFMGTDASTPINALDVTSFVHVDIVAHVEGSDTVAHILADESLGTGLRWQTVRWVNNLSPQLDNSGSSGTLLSAVGYTAGTCAIDFHHTGDGRTVQGGTPHLYVSWWASSPTGMYFHKISYSGGAWSLNTNRLLVTSDAEWGQSSFFDGTRWVGAFRSTTANVIKIVERDAADTTTTIHPAAPAIGGGDPLSFGISYDAANNVYLIGGETNSDVLQYVVFDRAGTSWGSWTNIIASPPDPTDIMLKRGHWSGDSERHSVELTWRESTQIAYENITLNNDPSAPTIDLPSDGGIADVAETLTIDWTFNDDDPGDTQSAYTLRRRIGGGAFNYWNGSTWQASEDASTKLSTVSTSQVLSASWGSDGDADHYYSVKTWDELDAGPSVWSSETRVTPSAQDNPSIDAPLNLATVGPVETVEWTVSTQSKYRVVVSDTSGAIGLGVLDDDTGAIVDSGTRSVEVNFPTNSVTRYVKLQTWNDEGLEGDLDEIQVSVSYTPPPTPTLAATDNTPEGAITVAITNPAPGGGEPSVLSNDLLRRESGDTGDGVRVAANVAANGSFVDYAVATGVVYEYRAKAYGDNGANSLGAWSVG